MTADTHPPGKLAFYIPYWRASPPLSSPDHFSSPFTSNLGEVELHGAIMGFLKKTETGGFFWEPNRKQPEKIGYQRKTQCEKQKGK